MGSAPKNMRREVIIGLLPNVLVAILVLAATHPSFNLPSACRWVLGVVALGVFAWFGLPWAVVGLTYLVLRKIGRAEGWMLKRLVTDAYPGSHYLRTMLDPKYRGDTVYAATAFVVSKSQKGKLLWVKHRTHDGRWLPPGGRLIVNELPHRGVIEKVFAETAIPKESLLFLDAFCPCRGSHIAADEPVEPAPVPLVVQTELMEQRGGVPFHYDFIYVLESQFCGAVVGDQHPQWLSIGDVEKFSPENQPFPNMLGLARQIMAKLDKEYKA